MTLTMLLASLLGWWIKKWMKGCGIGNGNKGGAGSGKSSLYVESYDNDSYDDYECEDLIEDQLAFCDAFDISIPS